MTHESNAAYLARRATTERRLAETSHDSAVRDAHRRMADDYAARLAELRQHQQLVLN